MTRVKIWGIKTLQDAKAVVEAGADALGFLVEVESAKSAVSAETAASIIAQLPQSISGVVVTTQVEPEALIRIVQTTDASVLQLQSAVTYDTIRTIRASFPDITVYVAVHVTDEVALGKAKKFEDIADGIVLDSIDKTSGALGGTGKTHDWDISRKIVESVSLPVILAGGLTPDNVAEAIQKVRPYAVDVQSGVSNPDGSKDLEKVRAFIKRAKMGL